MPASIHRTTSFRLEQIALFLLFLIVSAQAHNTNSKIVLHTRYAEQARIGFQETEFFWVIRFSPVPS